jgi:hypothetical protein
MDHRACNEWRILSTNFDREVPYLVNNQTYKDHELLVLKSILLLNKKYRLRFGYAYLETRLCHINKSLVQFLSRFSLSSEWISLWLWF